jgi:hypothetical protein
MRSDAAGVLQQRAVAEAGWRAELEASVAAIAASGIKLVVWDFDLTLLTLHSFGERIQPWAVAARCLEDDFWDLRFFCELVPALTAAGLRVAVASFGRYDVIQAYMDAAFAPLPPLIESSTSSLGQEAQGRGDRAAATPAARGGGQPANNGGWPQQRQQQQQQPRCGHD